MLHTLSSSSPERMAVSGVTPSSSSSAVPSMDLLSSFTRALKDKHDILKSSLCLTNLNPCVLQDRNCISRYLRTLNQLLDHIDPGTLPNFSNRSHSVKPFPLSWCFSIKQKGLNLLLIWGLQVHLPTTRCLSEWEEPVYGITQWHYHWDSRTQAADLSYDCLFVYCTKRHFYLIEQDLHNNFIPFSLVSEFWWEQVITFEVCWTRQDVFWPDGLRVDVDGGDALQQEFNHLQERVGGLFGKRQLPSDLPLHTVQTGHH